MFVWNYGLLSIKCIFNMHFHFLCSKNIHVHAHAYISFLPRTNLAGDSGGTQNITNVRRDSKAQGKIKIKV